MYVIVCARACVFRSYRVQHNAQKDMHRTIRLVLNQTDLQKQNSQLKTKRLF
uniref:Uncharacterized protein n=1 Tax=Anopheles christyi TaxID=43041 RepID=A0A182KJ08_9DIPT